jgi:hypothetical protein
MSAKLQNWLKGKLADDGSKGIPISEIPIMWEHATGSPFLLQQFGFSKRQGLCTALKTFSDTVIVTENEHKILTAYPAKKTGEGSTVKSSVLASQMHGSKIQPHPNSNSLSKLCGATKRPKTTTDINNDVKLWLHKKLISTSDQGLLASTIPDHWNSDR